MVDFRSSVFAERYENLIDLDRPIAAVSYNQKQEKSGYKFTVDSTNGVEPLDWYNAYIDVDFKVQKLDGGAIALEDNQGIVNGSHSLIHKLAIEVNGVEVYNCERANHAVNIKNLLEYSKSFAEGPGGTSQFFYLDANRNAKDDDAAHEDFNKGFALRKTLLGASGTVNTLIPLNRYSFFESLSDELLPNLKVTLEIELESDNNLIWRTAGAACRVVVTRMELVVPKIKLTGTGKKYFP